MLADRGYQEVVNFAFVERPGKPISRQRNPDPPGQPDRQPDGVMRSSLFGGLVATLVTNLKRKQTASACSKSAAPSIATPTASRSRASASRGSWPAWPSVAPAGRLGQRGAQG
jgi:phenylalanyl-tRNA synthetase beta subunit